MDELLILTLLAGRSPEPGSRGGFCAIRELPRRHIECQLCNSEVPASHVVAHGHAHVEAARAQCEALASVLAITFQEQSVAEAHREVFEVFGFEVRSGAAVAFWLVHPVPGQQPRNHSNGGER